MLHWFHKESCGGSRHTDKGGGGGGGHPDPEIRRGAVFFSALTATVWSKNKGGRGVGPSPGSATGESNDTERES